MADKQLKIAVIISAVDKMTRVINTAVDASVKKLGDVQKKADEISKASASFGKDAIAVGAAAGASLAYPVKSFADLEEAATRLKSVMLKDGGVLDAKTFEKVSKEATILGNELPGTTADFYNMFETLINGGVSAESILKGTGRSAAYLATALKIPYEEAAMSAAKLKNATGVTDEKMMEFMDTIARMKQFNVSATEMEYAFGRSSGTLKTLGIQGLDASKKMGTLFAMMIQGGLSGETVGTGMTAIMNSFYDTKKMANFNAEASKMGMAFSFVDEKTGKFKGVENMVAQFDKIKALNPQQANSLIQALTGGGQDANMVKILVDQGVAGFNKYQRSMASQATLNDKVGLQMKTLKAQWEAATGTFSNSMAAVGAKLAPILINLINRLNKLSEWISKFVEKYPKMTAAIVGGIAAFAGIAVAAGGVGLVISGVTKTVSLITTGLKYFGSVLKFTVGALKFVGSTVMWLGRIMMANPILLVIAAIAAAVYLIYRNWDKIKAFFTNLWANIKRIFMDFVNWVLNWPIMKPIKMIIENWDKIKLFFKNLWPNIKQYFLDFVNWIAHIPGRMYDAGKNIIKSIWEGMKSVVMKPINMVKDMVKKIRDFLPFSPAKEGALKDIHKIRLVETIAENIKPGPMVRAMRSTTAAAMIAASPVSVPASPLSAMGGGITGGGMASGGGGGITVHYSPVITIQGGAAANMKDDFAAMLKKHSKEINAVIKEELRKEQRSKY